MKIKYIFAFSIAAALLLSGCGQSSEEASEPSSEASETIEETDASPAIEEEERGTEAAAKAPEAETGIIMPIERKSSEAGHDGSHAVSFDPSEIKTENGTIVIPMTFYSYDEYEAEDIEGASVGDKLRFCGKDLTITKLENGKYGIYVNGGLDNGGIDLVKSDSGFYESQEYDDHKSYYTVGKADMELSASAVYTDYASSGEPDDPGVKYHYSDLPAAFDDQIGFTQLNTTADIKDGKVVSIFRRWIP